MHAPDAFAELLLLLLIAVGAAAVFLRLRLPPVLGYIAVGLASGPTALALVQDVEAIRSVAELGVVLLLSMAVAPLALRFNGRIVSAFIRRPAEAPAAAGAAPEHGGGGDILLVGFGRVGQNVARVLDDAGVA